MTAPDTYFADPTGTATEDGRFYRVDQLAAVEIVSGLTLRPIVSTTRCWASRGTSRSPRRHATRT